jgi:hypothetical protein
LVGEVVVEVGEDEVEAGGEIEVGTAIHTSTHFLMDVQEDTAHMDATSLCTWTTNFHCEILSFNSRF